MVATGYHSDIGFPGTMTGILGNGVISRETCGFTLVKVVGVVVRTQGV